MWPLSLPRQSLLADLKVKFSHTLTLALNVIPLKSAGWNICPWWVSLKILSWGLTENLNCSVTHPQYCCFSGNTELLPPPGLQEQGLRQRLIHFYNKVIPASTEMIFTNKHPLRDENLWQILHCHLLSICIRRREKWIFLPMEFCHWIQRSTRSEALTCSLNTLPKNSHNCLNPNLRSQEVNCLVQVMPGEVWVRFYGMVYSITYSGTQSHGRERILPPV